MKERAFSQNTAPEGGVCQPSIDKTKRKVEETGVWPNHDNRLKNLRWGGLRKSLVGGWKIEGQGQPFRQKNMALTAGKKPKARGKGEVRALNEDQCR